MTTWEGCYEGNWRGVITDASFAHPAKFAHNLIARIYAHLLEQGYIAPGSTVVDPFAGIGCGGIYAAMYGLRWVGCELEPRFVSMAQDNFALHRRTWEQFGDPLPVCVQGDSRNLRAVLGPVLAECVVGSPPYARSHVGAEDNPYAHTDGKSMGDARNAHLAGSTSYGDAPGQLSQLPPGRVDAVVGSPPYEGCLNDGVPKEKYEGWNNPDGSNRLAKSIGQNYSDNANNLGNSTGETFWSAARLIVQECHAILKPGGIAVWVLKSFCRDGTIVDFPGDWERLCHACGFKTVEEIHASLVKEDSHPSLFGGKETKRIARKSFFRRLHEKKRPDLAIDFEVVLVTMKE